MAPKKKSAPLEETLEPAARKTTTRSARAKSAPDMESAPAKARAATAAAAEGSPAAARVTSEGKNKAAREKSEVELLAGQMLDIVKKTAQTETSSSSSTSSGAVSGILQPFGSAPIALVNAVLGEVLQHILNAELEAHLGISRYQRQPKEQSAAAATTAAAAPATAAAPETADETATGAAETAAPKATRNYRNGFYRRTIKTTVGNIDLKMPRDRQGTFQSQIVPAFTSDFGGFAYKILGLLAEGCSYNDCTRIVKMMTGVDISPESAHQIMLDYQNHLLTWLKRPLKPCYPFLFIDRLYVPIRDQDRQVAPNSIYMIFGINPDGQRELIHLYTVTPDPDEKNPDHAAGVTDAAGTGADGVDGTSLVYDDRSTDPADEDNSAADIFVPNQTPDMDFADDGAGNSLSFAPSDWKGLFQELKQRGLKHVLFVNINHDTQIADGIRTVYPEAHIQFCTLQMLHACTRELPAKQRKEFGSDIRACYKAANLKAAHKALQALFTKWQPDYPAAVEAWFVCFTRHIAPLYDYPECIRNLIYTSNALTTIIASMRKVVAGKGCYSSQAGILALFLLRAERVFSEQWQKPLSNWTKIRKALATMPRTADIMRSYQSANEP